MIWVAFILVYLYSGIVTVSNALRAAFQILEVAPSLYMVELRKSQGDTLEFHKVSLMQKICMYLFIEVQLRSLYMKKAVLFSISTLLLWYRSPSKATLL